MAFAGYCIAAFILVIALFIWAGLLDLEDEISKSVQKKISDPRPLLDHLRTAPNTVIVTETHGGEITHQAQVYQLPYQTSALETRYHSGWPGPTETRPEY